jgi:hypothetical protein
MAARLCRISWNWRAPLTWQLLRALIGAVKPELPEVISWESRRISGRAAWPIAVVLLAAALAAAVGLAVQYHRQVVALGHRLPTPPASPTASKVLPTMLNSTVALPTGKTLNGAVTVVSAKSTSGQARIVLSVYITGGGPDTAYTLIAFDCTGKTGYQPWAYGKTESRGSGVLSGRTWLVFLKDRYWFYLSSSNRGSSGPGLLGSFSAAGRFTATPATNPACS